MCVELVEVMEKFVDVEAPHGFLSRSSMVLELMRRS